jgi:hypothetical protein
MPAVYMAEKGEKEGNDKRDVVVVCISCWYRRERKRTS